MILRAHMDKLRSLIIKSSASLSDTDALEAVELFAVWASDTDYAVGDRVSYDGTLYKCLTAHTSQSTWTPDASPSLWVRVDDPSIEWPEWIQPVGSTDAYPLGAKVSHNGKHWISDVDGNVWEPGVAMWHEATE
ncbi:MAG: alpha-amylase [Lachnospiraceae bacterium]|nr:alpha-amylase [Oscillospiraceae bacterium]MBR3170332.1 alpha-amylase [Lachnospiraceae bacterium]